MATQALVNDVCRFTVLMHWTNGRKIANNLDMRIFSIGAGTTRETAIQDQADVIGNAWADEIISQLPNNITFDGVRWLDLDALDGSTGQSSASAGAVGPSTGPSASPQVCYLMRKIIGSHGRGKRNGRLYLAGVGESHVDEDGNVDVDFASTFESFMGNINQDGLVTAPIYDSRLCVVHLEPLETPPQAVRNGTSSDVQSWVSDGRVATQRRRLR